MAAYSPEAGRIFNDFGFVRVAAASPKLRIGDCAFNAERAIELMRQAEVGGARILLFPELSLTGYTCGDLFQDATLLACALVALDRVVEASKQIFSGIAVVGLPIACDDQLFNCAALVQGGHVYGLVPKSYLPNYREFYEQRWFAPGNQGANREIVSAGQRIPFGTDLLFKVPETPGLTIGIEICEDLWAPIPPSSYQALRGATVLLNPSASNEVIGKYRYRRQLVESQSGRCLAAYVFAACGVHESTTDVVFGGNSLIAENGVILAEAARFQRDDSLITEDIDLDRIVSNRRRLTTFGAAKRDLRDGQVFREVIVPLARASQPLPLARLVDPHPFVPRGEGQLRERCEEIFEIQVAGLAKRLEQVGKPAVAIGISGGLDSTLALLVACKTFDRIGESRKKIQCLTMPGFGTSSRTLHNARALMQQLGVGVREIDIRPLCFEEMRSLGYKPFGIEIEGLSAEAFAAKLQQVPAELCQDVGFENIQARMRTSLLMNSGFVIGTGDLSELALGWCTYNADHMSMYNPNVSIPKTLVKFLVRWVAGHEFDGAAQMTLLDITATEISPELLPASGAGQQVQSTEQTIGPYELHDFFLYHFLRFGTPPEKIVFLAEQAPFDQAYSPEELRRWLAVFIRRFFSSQFKRSCLPDGPKVGTVSLSPRGDWRMPSDAEAAAWLEWEKEVDSERK